MQLINISAFFIKQLVKQINLNILYDSEIFPIRFLFTFMKLNIESISKYCFIELT